MTDTPRPVQPRLWQNLAMASAAFGLAAMPSLAQGDYRAPSNAADMGATLWLAQTEGGEGGEAGAVADLSDDVTYLARLSIVEGHIVASFDLYAKGMVDEAIGLSYHPEAEMMEDVRADIAAHGMPDVTPAMSAFSGTLERGATLEEAAGALAHVQAAVAAAAAPEADNNRARYDAMIAVIRAAASEYASATEEGVVGDIMAYHEAHAFVAVARALAQGLAQTPETKAAADKALIALQGADEAFGDMNAATLEARDPAILLGVAARVELVGSAVR